MAPQQRDNRHEPDDTMRETRHCRPLHTRPRPRARKCAARNRPVAIALGCGSRDSLGERCLTGATGHRWNSELPFPQRRRITTQDPNDSCKSLVLRVRRYRTLWHAPSDLSTDSTAHSYDRTGFPWLRRRYGNVSHQEMDGWCPREENPSGLSQISYRSANLVTENRGTMERRPAGNTRD